ncbi:MAG TPA: hypothetical protein VG755_15640, partial [Nannocystaceae bacterium]|nr:hypothetical protein [Nannocystaceae bacterium]
MASVLAGCPDDDTPVSTVGDETSSSEGGEESNTNATVTQTTTMDTTADTTADTTDTDVSTTTLTTSDTDESTSSTDAESSSSSDGGPVCGDDVADRGEECDGTDLGGADCASQGFDGGTLTCAADCTLDTSACTNNCGNGAVDMGEDCDGVDLDGEDCLGLGYDGGVLACANDCSFDITGCTMATCGDDTVQGAEVCDGTDLAGEDCVSQGFTGGTLGCAGNCLAFDTSACLSAPTCCTAQGMGVNGCSDDTCEMAVCGIDSFCCTNTWDGQCVGEAYDLCPMVCTPVCGDGIASAGAEQCDGADLGGGSCASEGFGSGTIACDAACNYDTSGCIDVPDEWTCNPAFYGTDDGCDCGCGALDPDCADNTAASCGFCGDAGSCDTTGAGCPGIIDPVDNTSCVAPPEWTCNVGFFDADDGCDCGCGAFDPDCADNTAASCGFCNDTGSCDGTGGGCPGLIDSDDNSTCEVPAGWTCNEAFFNTDDGCDCGCGVVDPDCADETGASCQFCNDTGSCDDTGAGCPGIIDIADNAHCSGAPNAWTCSDSFYNADDGCDCG